MNKYLYIFVFFSIVSFIVLNYWTEKYKTPDSSVSAFELTDAEFYFINNDINQESKVNWEMFCSKCEISENFRNISAKDNITGKFYTDNDIFDFKCDALKYSHFKNNVFLNNLKIYLDSKTEIFSQNTVFDISENSMVSSGKITFRKNNISGTCKKCFADLNKKEIIQQNTELIIDYEK